MSLSGFDLRSYLRHLRPIALSSHSPRTRVSSSHPPRRLPRFAQGVPPMIPVRLAALVTTVAIVTAVTLVGQGEPKSSAGKMQLAADKFLGALSPELKKKAAFAYSDRSISSAPSACRAGCAKLRAMPLTKITT